MLDVVNMWHQRARPNPTAENLGVQMGCHFEEVLEMLETLGSKNPVTTYALAALHDNLVWLSMGLKRGEISVDITNRKAFLDSLADQIVTAVGVGHCANMNTPEAVLRVNKSNWSKFSSDGQPSFDSNGKISKPSTYQPPDLEGLY